MRTVLYPEIMTDAPSDGDTYGRLNADWSILNVSNWDTAYGWGDHAFAGYLTGPGGIDTELQWNNAGVLDGISTVTSDGTDVTWATNAKAFFGTAQDASIYYDATNLVIDPKAVGSGYLNILGSAYVNNTLGVGVAPSTGTAIKAYKAYTDTSGAKYGFYFYPDLSPSADGTASLYAIGLYPSWGSGNNANGGAGFYIEPTIGHTAGTLTSITGAQTGGYFNSASAGTITEWYGFRINNPAKHASSTETVGTQYQLYVQTPSRGSVNWAVYSQGGNNYFGGDVIHPDNAKSFYGTASDASIYYDATNLVINPKAVGSGYLSVLSSIYQNRTFSTPVAAAEYGISATSLWSAADTGVKAGLYFYAGSTHTTGTVASVYGVYGYGVSLGNGGTTTTLVGGLFQPFVQTGNTATNVSSIMAGAGTQNGTTTNRYGVNILANTTAYSTNKYGLYIGDQSGASSKNYAIYTNDGLIYFADSVQIAADNKSLTVGTENDAGMYYDGTDLCIDTALVGTGTLNLVSQSASAITTETLSHYVTIKLGGTPYKIAIVS